MPRKGIEILYRSRSTSRRDSGRQLHPFLLRNVAIERANHLWAPHRHQHERQDLMKRQHFHRTLLARGEFKGGVPAGLRGSVRGAVFHRTLHRLPQRRVDTILARRSHARRGILRLCRCEGGGLSDIQPSGIAPRKLLRSV